MESEATACPKEVGYRAGGIALEGVERFMQLQCMKRGTIGLVFSQNETEAVK